MSKYEKYRIEISSDSKEVIEHIFVDLGSVFDKYGAKLKPLNKNTTKLLEENSR